jgi:hypothetical protein
MSTRRKFKCTTCYHQFSVTSGTISSVAGQRGLESAA